MEESKEKVSMSEEKGKISVIVPVYQAEKYLAKALDSVISQDYENWELFLLVRKSSDQSEKIVRDYEKKYDSIHMIERGENKAGEARNQGLEKAQGEYVLFLDSDDYLPDASVMQRYVRMAEQTDTETVNQKEERQSACDPAATFCNRPHSCHDKHIVCICFEKLRYWSFQTIFINDIRFYPHRGQNRAAERSDKNSHNSEMKYKQNGNAEVQQCLCDRLITVIPEKSHRLFKD